MSGPDPAAAAAWGRALAAVIDASHLTPGEDLSDVVDRAVRPLGLGAEILLVDLAQRRLTPVGPADAAPLAVEGTVAGRAYQLGEILPAGEGADRVLWVPLLDGTERVGLLRVGLGPGTTDDALLRQWVWTMAGLVGHVVVAKIVYSDRLRAMRAGGVLSVASELAWQMLPPRTFATGNAVVTALLEPVDQVAGDAYDYALHGDTLVIAVFDGVGHDIPAAQVTALVSTAIRNARRAGHTDPLVLAATADRVLAALPDAPAQFVTAVLARLDIRTGQLDLLLAGHPPPLLFRGGSLVRELAPPPRPPLGVAVAGAPPPVVLREQLEPGDRVLAYSDGIVEARDADGAFFGERRLIDFAGRAEQDGLNAPETLRRLGAAVLAHQGDRLQDDATLLLVDWSVAGPGRLLPKLGSPRVG